MENRLSFIVLSFAWLAGCAMSRENIVTAADVRVCLPPTGPVQTILYITPSDDPQQCVIVDRGAPALFGSPCDEIGWSRDGTDTPIAGVPVAGVDATVEGRVDLRPGYVDYDYRVTLVPDSGAVRIVEAVGTWGPFPAGEAGCFVRVMPSP